MSSTVPCLGIFYIFIFCFVGSAAAQSPISTNMPVPPLQWLNLTGLTQGPLPQPLKDSSIGYDDLTRSLIIFGGESQGGVPQQTTYLLNMDSLTWSTPLSKVPSKGSSPPSRSQALGTGDFAVNSRRDFLVYGGMGSDKEALDDVWAYDFQNQFWTSVTLFGTPPSARWGALGGIDPANVASSANNVSTIFDIAGGANSQMAFPSSDLWQLNVTGTLASDLFTIQGVWQNLSLSSHLPGKVEAGGTVISQNQATTTRIVISGGCGSNAISTSSNVSCVDPSTYVLAVSPSSSISISQCPAPRFRPVIVPNLSAASSSFASQAFVLLGTFDTSKWNDGGGLSRGEVAVLDVNAATWARVLPAGDPGSGSPTFPTPREGAAALSFPSALVGRGTVSASDTIVFGGRDAHGSYLNEIWVLRAYNGSVSQSGVHWAGYGNGKLGTGVSASGSGVSVQYQAQCAQQLFPTSTSSASSTSITGVGSPGGTGSPLPSSIATFDVSIGHKILSSVSLVIALAATILVRLFSPSASKTSTMEHHPGLLYVAVPASVVAYAVGVAGFAISLAATTRSLPNLQRRDGTSSDTLLKTVHGQAGLALFAGLYGIVPILALSLWLARRFTHTSPDSQVDDEVHGESSHDTGPLTGEKDTPITRRPASPAQSAPEVHSAESSSSGRDRRQRTQSVPGLFPGWTRDRKSSENSESGPSNSSKGFEVMNRPRRASGGMALYPTRDFTHRPRADLIRSLGDISWLERRRSVGVVGELDYALSQLGHASPRSTSPPVTSRPPTVTMSNRPFVRTPTPQTPSNVDLNGWDILLHTLFHIFLLANCILALAALFSRAPLATFIVFLIWMLAFYVSLLLMAWNGHPRSSLLVIAFTRLRTPAHMADPPPTRPGSPMDEHESHLFQPPTPVNGPYIYHQPLWRRAISPEDDFTASHAGGHRMLEQDDPEDDDEDDDDRQRRMEEELERRDVNIVTVPRRRLWITNPS